MRRDSPATVGTRHALTDTRLATTPAVVGMDEVADRLLGLATAVFGAIASGASIMVADPGGTLHAIASSSEQARLIEGFELQHDEGPCLDAYRTGRAVHSGTTDDANARWPRYAAYAGDLGFRSVCALPMRLGTDVIGVLNLFSATPEPLSPRDQDAAQAIADIAAIGIVQQRVLHDRDIVNSQLQTALESRIRIEQAKGIVGEHNHISVDDAFTLLRGYARRHNDTLVQTARDVVTGALSTETLGEGPSVLATRPQDAEPSTMRDFVTPSERQLSDVLSEFARTLLTDFPIQAILDHLVVRIVDVLPITSAGMTLISPGTYPRYVAASDPSALCYEELQTELGEGPCVEACQTGMAVSVPDLRDESRFPQFVSSARATGLAAAFTFPLRHGDEQLGALDLYRDTPGPLDTATMAAAQTLADVAAAYLLNAQARADLRDTFDRAVESALHDPLTGLPNRVLFLERLDHAVLRGRRLGKLSAVIFVDLDRFKLVNDLYGHSVGDELLVAVGQRLTAVLRPGDSLARLSGDEFVVLCEDVDGTAPVEAIAARIGAALAEPFILSGIEIEMTASVGIAFCGRADQLSEDIIKDADTAMYQAKRKGGARQQVIDLREQHVAQEHASLERDLRGALARGEFHTEYQPIVNTGDQQVAGVEALLRWAHPSRGLVPPAWLIPVAERSGLIGDIGQWVLEQACSDLRRWHDNLDRALTMSVNVSAHQLIAPDYAATVAGVLAGTDTDPKWLVLEVTESVFVQDSKRALVVLNDLKSLGVQLALDDFGTGYSSLNYLKRFPIDIVKIDRGFVSDLARDLASHCIVGAVVELAHLLGMTVVAEGVETAEQHRQLASLGCDSCQGYYFARPAPAADLDTLISERVAG